MGLRWPRLRKYTHDLIPLIFVLFPWGSMQQHGSPPIRVHQGLSSCANSFFFSAGCILRNRSSRFKTLKQLVPDSRPSKLNADLNHQANMAEQFCRYRLKELKVLAKSHPNTPFSLAVLHFIFSAVATLGNILVIRALF